MKKYISILLSTLCIFSIIGCHTSSTTESETPSQDFFNAVVLEANDDVILSQCTACESGAIPTGSKVSIGTNTISSEEVPILNVGDTIRVVYIGDVLETDPLQLQEVISIFWIDENGAIVTEPMETNIEQLDTPNWGITFTAENVTPTGLTIKCAQTGGEPTGELQTGSEYVLEKFANNTWEKVEYLPQEYDIAWTAEAWMISPEDTVNWDVNWEWLYGPLPAGQYRIGKEIMDFRGPGDYDTAIHYAEFTIN